MNEEKIINIKNILYNIIYITIIFMFVTILVLNMLNSNMNKGPHYIKECVKSHGDITYITFYNSTTHMINMQSVPINVCDKYDYRCIPAGKYYTGKYTCENLIKSQTVKE